MAVLLWREGADTGPDRATVPRQAVACR